MTKTTKTFETAEQAAASWLRKAKRIGGFVQTLGGGWWVVRTARPGSGVAGRKLQGLVALGHYLRARGVVVEVPAPDRADRTFAQAWASDPRPTAVAFALRMAWPAPRPVVVATCVVDVYPDAQVWAVRPGVAGGPDVHGTTWAEVLPMLAALPATVRIVVRAEGAHR
jgi:hypothetical protein